MRTVFGLLVLLAGCSAGRPSAHTIAMTDRPCTTSTDAPAIDTLIAGAAGLVTLVAAYTVVGAATADDDPSDSNGIVGGTALAVAVPGAIVTLGYGMSARHGFRSADACAARERLR